MDWEELALWLQSPTVSTVLMAHPVPGALRAVSEL